MSNHITPIVLAKEQDVFEINGVVYKQGMVIQSKYPELNPGNRDIYYMYKDGVFIGKIHKDKIQK